MREPSDSALLWDAVRVMTRLLRQASTLPGAPVILWRDRRRMAKLAIGSGCCSAGVAMASFSTMMRLVPLLWLLLVLSACSLVGPSGPPYLVYFQERSAQLDAPARNVIALAALRANDEPAAPVDVIGYTDSAGSPPADVLLSQHRAQAVADALVAYGVAANRLVLVGRGQAGGDPGIASRRVQITIGGG